MAFKLNISDKGKAWKLETESEILAGKKISDTIQGKEISHDLDGYELTITGASDFAGFPHKHDLEGPEKRKIILTKGWGMHKKPRKEGKKKVQTPDGLRLRKSVRGNQISEKTAQINMKVTKAGKKPLKEIFPEQNKEKAQVEKTEQMTMQRAGSQQESSVSGKGNNETAEKIAEEIAEEVKEEIENTIPASPETKTKEQKEEAAEIIAEEVKEEIENVAEKLAKKK